MSVLAIRLELQPAPVYNGTTVTKRLLKLRDNGVSQCAGVKLAIGQYSSTKSESREV